MSLFDNQTIDIPCPKCGHKTKKSLGRMKPNEKIACAKCGETFICNNKEALRKLKDLEEKISKIGFRKK